MFIDIYYNLIIFGNTKIKSLGSGIASKMCFVGGQKSKLLIIGKSSDCKFRLFILFKVFATAEFVIETCPVSHYVILGGNLNQAFSC